MEWVNIKDEYPKNDQVCWFYSTLKKKGVFKQKWFYSFYINDIKRFKVTHWMPYCLPDPPTTLKKENTKKL